MNGRSLPRNVSRVNPIRTNFWGSSRIDRQELLSSQRIVTRVLGAHSVHIGKESLFPLTYPQVEPRLPKEASAAFRVDTDVAALPLKHIKRGFAYIAFPKEISARSTHDVILGVLRSEVNLKDVGREYTWGKSPR
jgi:hypothetical protein